MFLGSSFSVFVEFFPFLSYNVGPVSSATYAPYFADLLQEIERAFSGTERSERVIQAERICTVFDFTAFFNPLGLSLERLTRSACFLFVKDPGGRTIVRSKKHSHLADWEDDGTVALFHVSFCMI